MRKIASVTALLAVVFVTAASAQQPPTVRIRGTIEAVDGATLSIKSRDGSDVKVNITDNIAVTGVAKASLSDVKEGSYIGVSAMPEPDGTQKAIAVHIFPEALRGAGEGFRPWDLRPNSTMTNATVAQTVASVDGQTIMVKYKDGEKKVIVPPSTPVVSFTPGSKADLKTGAQIFIVAGQKQADGSITAPAITVGRDGAAPPM